ncbi:MAG: dTDP-4-dehydrorhamnose 3,5-epimerase [Candidatus Moranbacteria bacterium]|nr:dTDP-4-dehydrorhamnose 3,5-epimerase [Candidatus Moranbacteria bacterium]
MNVIQTEIPGVLIIEPDVFSDERGYFKETYNRDRYRELGLPDFVQDNLSLSIPVGTLRGLHYQVAPFAQGKLIQVVQGEVFDVAADIRRDSSTFGKSVSAILSAENHRQFYIPEGFAHAFLTTKPGTIFSYKCTNVYSKDHDRGIFWDDPALGIDWPIREGLTISQKDTNHPALASLESDPVRWEELKIVK